MVACISECKIISISAIFLDLFPTQEFSLKFSKEGRGNLTILRRYSNIRVRHRIINDSLCQQQIFPLNPEDDSICTTAVSYVPPSYQLDDKVESLLTNFEICAGDFNVYLDENSNSARDQIFQKMLEKHDLTSISDHRTFDSKLYAGTRRQSRYSSGPDIMVQKTDLLPRDTKITEVLGDHHGILVDLTRDPSVSNYRSDNNRKINKKYYEIQLVDRSKIDISYLRQLFDNLRPNPNIAEFKNCWDSVIKPATRKYRVPERVLDESKLSPLGCKLRAANSTGDMDKVLNDILKYTESLIFLGPAHKILNHLANNADEASKCSQIEEIIGREVSEKLAYFESIKQALSTSPAPSNDTIENVRNGKKFWRKIRKCRGFRYFNYSELRQSLRDINKSSIGIDNISYDMFPRKPDNIRKMLYMINGLIFHSNRLPKWLITSRLTLIPKRSNGIRPITGQSRLLTLMDSLVCRRLNQAICNDTRFDSRFGFLKGRSTNDFIGLEIKNILNAGKKSKIGLAQADLSGAYDKTEWSTIKSKVFNFVKSQKKRQYITVCLGYIEKWLDPRRTTVWNHRRINIRRGLPQGSPLSCTIFVLYFDLVSQDNNLVKQIFYADDSSAIFASSSTSATTESIINYSKELETWCKTNHMAVSSSKSEVLFINSTKSSTSHLNLPYKQSTSSKILGIIVDNRLNFNCHLHKIEKWVDLRCYALRKMSYLGLKPAAKYRIINALVNYITYGFWWIFFLSQTNFDKLQSFYHRLIKSAFGVRKAVPPRKLTDALGLQSLIDILRLRTATTFLENQTNPAKPDLLIEALRLGKDRQRQQIINNNSCSSRTLRASTTRKTRLSRQLAQQREQGIPDRMIDMALFCNSCVDAHKNEWKEASPLGRKGILRRIFYKKKRWPEFEKIDDIVEELNVKYDYNL